MGGWGRANGPGPNGFGGMPYPPPPGWFPPGQDFPPMGPGPWNNYAFPPGPGGPPGIPGQPPRQFPGAQGPNSQAQAQNATPKPAPIGSYTDKDRATPTQSEQPLESKAAPQPPTQIPGQQPLQASKQPTSQPPTFSAPPPPVESKPSVEEVRATAASLKNDTNKTSTTTSAQDSKPSVPAVPTGPKSSRAGQILPAMPLPAALTSKAAPSAPASSNKGKNEVANPAAIHDATQAARAAVAMAMARLENPEAAQTAAAEAADNMTKKVEDLRMNNPRAATNSNRGGRGRGPRPAKVDVPDADFDFATSNAKFNKEDVVKEAIAGSPLTETPNGDTATFEAPVESSPGANPPPAYNKSRSFFDNISSEAKDRADNHGQKPGGREWRGEEQRKNMETFGLSSVDGGYRNYRGRGRGRGGRGRGGYNRGGRGGGGFRRDAAVSQS
jgi:protein LSM14